MFACAIIKWVACLPQALVHILFMIFSHRWQSMLDGLFERSSKWMVVVPQEFCQVLD